MIIISWASCNNSYCAELLSSDLETEMCKVAVNVDLTTGIQDNGGALMDAHLFSFSKRKESGGTVA